MQDSKALPDLRVLPANLVTPHEDVDPRRVARLAERLLQEGRLKHPPVVAPIPETERFVVLDGANRCLALQKLGAPYLFAQVVHYGQPGLILDTWYHVVSGMELETFEQALQGIDGFRLLPASLEEARQALATGNAAAYIIAGDSVRIVCPRQGCTRDLALLREIVNAYKGRADIFRASNDDWNLQAPYYPQITALVIFPQLQPADILQAARSGEFVPSGITRHLIPNRAINTNFDLQVLLSPGSLEEKQAWLREWLMERMAANAIRYYAESTFTFDE
jgi:hypothetical protein